MKTLLKNAMVLDALTEYRKLDVLIEGESIVEVLPGLTASPDTQLLDLDGCTIMPSLIDAHVHVAVGPGEYDGALLQNLAESGLSAAKDLGMLCQKPLEGYIQFLEEHRLPQHIQVATAGRYIDVEGGYGMGPNPAMQWGIVVNSLHEAAEAVSYQADCGVQGIKLGLSDGTHGPVEAKMPPEFIRAVTNRASSYGLWTTAHVGTVDDLRTMVENGIGEAAHTPGDREMDDELIAMMVDKGVSMTTTVGRPDKFDHEPDHLPPVYESGAQFNAAMKRRRAVHLTNLGKFYSAGGIINIGTDLMNGRQHLSEQVIPYWELANLHVLGMPLREVVRCGTLNAAASCGLYQQGQVEPGMLANLIAFPGRLDAGFTQLHRPPLVIHRGTVLKSALDGGKS